MNGYISVEYIQCQCFLALHCSCKYMLSFISVLILKGSCSCTITLQLIFLCPPFSTHQIYIYSYQKVGTEEVQLCIALGCAFCLYRCTYIYSYLVMQHHSSSYLKYSPFLSYIITSIFTLNKMQNKGNAYEEDSVVNFSSTIGVIQPYGKSKYRSDVQKMEGKGK